MRSFILSSFILFFTIVGKAQVNKGAFLIGGDLGISSEKRNSSDPQNDADSKAIIVLPALGKAIKQNLIIGVYGLYSFSEYNHSINENDYELQKIGAGLFGRKYKRIGKTDFAVFFQGKTGVEFEERITGIGTLNKENLNTFRIVTDITPGISYGISKKLQLEMGLSSLLYFYYYHGKGTRGTLGSETYTTDGFYLFANLENVGQFFLGFRLLFNK